MKPCAKTCALHQIGHQNMAGRCLFLWQPSVLLYFSLCLSSKFSQLVQFDISLRSFLISRLHKMVGFNNIYAPKNQEMLQNECIYTGLFAWWVFWLSNVSSLVGQFDWHIQPTKLLNEVLCCTALTRQCTFMIFLSACDNHWQYEHTSLLL